MAPQSIADGRVRDETSPSEVADFGGVVDGTSDGGAWDAYNANRAADAQHTHGWATDHRGWSTDHRGSWIGHQHEYNRSWMRGADDAAWPPVGGDDAEKAERVKLARQAAVNAVTVQVAWKSFNMDIRVWDRTMWELGVDHAAIERLHELAEDHGDLGYMMANGIIAKVLGKQGKVEAYEQATPSAFVWTSVGNAIVKVDQLDKKRSRPPRVNPQSSIEDWGRSSKGSKTK